MASSCSGSYTIYCVCIGLYNIHIYCDCIHVYVGLAPFCVLQAPVRPYHQNAGVLKIRLCVHILLSLCASPELLIPNNLSHDPSLKYWPTSCFFSSEPNFQVCVKENYRGSVYLFPGLVVVKLAPEFQLSHFFSEPANNTRMEEVGNLSPHTPDRQKNS